MTALHITAAVARAGESTVFALRAGGRARQPSIANRCGDRLVVGNSRARWPRPLPSITVRLRRSLRGKVPGDTSVRAKHGCPDRRTGSAR